MAQKLKIIPLGGLEEVGKNMMVIQYGKQFIVIDAGLMFPDDDMPGIDLVLPDFSYVEQNAKHLLGVILTHGHEDHIGGLPYLLKKAPAKVFGTKLTLGMIKSKLDEHHLKAIGTTEIHAGSVINLGPFTLEFMRVSHSIPDGVALAIHTPIGVIVHSGDFKFDQSPVDGKVTDFGKLSVLGNKGVLLLMSDSTNAEVAGMTLPEKNVGDTLDEIFYKSRRRIIVASFASHIHRIQQILDTANKHRRKVTVSGRTMSNNIEIASRLGYLNIPPGLLVSNKEAQNIKPNRLVILCTGSQGEPLSALVRIAMGDHRYIRIERDDTVVISASPVPGNETAVSKTINLLFKSGADVKYESVSDVHVSGHACAEELKMMINLVRPKYLMPIHGEQRQLVHHARIAQDVGMASKNVFLMGNGDVLELDSEGQCRKKQPVKSGIVLVDGLGVGDVVHDVLFDRKRLSRDGICVVALAISKGTGMPVGEPSIDLKGVIRQADVSGIIKSSKECVLSSVGSLKSNDHLSNIEAVSECIRNSLGAHFHKTIRRRPTVIPMVLEI